ncbi:hypothetical protein IWQ60_004322 [Tieghemiomyces parasiticus]|uniref:Uncharacterized protein n=1 Tax=Tieghemiomyces parasiticus TaxID=78921 RepID=A0A9W8AG33_9FUNG|nr:hypothetical protein IWQ60_004322 [Tieghemiomyces parasiticus]
MGTAEGSLVQQLIEAQRQVARGGISATLEDPAALASLRLLGPHADRLPVSWFTPAFIQGTLRVATALPSTLATPAAAETASACARLWTQWLRRRDTSANPVVNPLLPGILSTLDPWLGAAERKAELLSAFVVPWALLTGLTHAAGDQRIGETLVRVTGTTLPTMTTYHQLDTVLASLAHYFRHLTVDTPLDFLRTVHGQLLDVWGRPETYPATATSSPGTNAGPAISEVITSPDTCIARIAQMYGFLAGTLVKMPRTPGPRAVLSSTTLRSQAASAARGLLGLFYLDAWLPPPGVPTTPTSSRPIGIQFPPGSHLQLLSETLRDYGVAHRGPGSALAMGTTFAITTHVLGALLHANDYQEGPGSKLGHHVTLDALTVDLNRQIAVALDTVSCRNATVPTGLYMGGLGHLAVPRYLATPACFIARLTANQRVGLLDWTLDYLLGHGYLFHLGPTDLLPLPVETRPMDPDNLYTTGVPFATRLAHPNVKALPRTIRLYRALLRAVDDVRSTVYHVGRWESYLSNLFVAADRARVLETGALIRQASPAPVIALGHSPAEYSDLGRLLQLTLMTATLVFEQAIDLHLDTVDAKSLPLFLATLNAYAQASPFLLTLFGPNGFTLYRQVCSRLVTALLHTEGALLTQNNGPGNQHCDRAVQYLCSTCLDAGDGLTADLLPTGAPIPEISLARQLRHLYFMQTLETLLPHVDEPTARQACLPFLHRYLLGHPGPYGKPLLQAAHRLMLTVLEIDHLEPLAVALGPYYGQTLLDLYPAWLEFDQVRAAYSVLVQRLMQCRPELGWTLVETLCAQLDRFARPAGGPAKLRPTTSSTPNGSVTAAATTALAPPTPTAASSAFYTHLLHGQYIQLLADQVVTVPFPYFDQLLLPRVREQILGAPSAVMRAAAVKELHEHMVGRTDLGKKARGLPWLMQLEREVRQGSFADTAKL